MQKTPPAERRNGVSGAKRFRSGMLGTALGGCIGLAVFALGGGLGHSFVQAAPILLNPGFEEGAGAHPAVWGITGEPVWIRDPAQAHSGQAAIRVSGFHGYYQTVTGLPARTHVTVAGYARSESGPSRVRLQASFRPASIELNHVNTTGDAGTSHTPFSFPMAVSPSADTATLYLNSYWSEEWITVDDIELLVERAENGGFEREADGDATAPRGWTRVGDGVWDRSGAESFAGLGVIGCGSGAWGASGNGEEGGNEDETGGDGWSAEWATAPDGQRVVLTFRTRAEVETSSPVRFSLEWLDFQRQPIAQTPLLCIVGPTWTVQTFAMFPPREKGIAAARIRFVPQAPPPEEPTLNAAAPAPRIWVDEVAWGWVAAYPSILSPNGDGIGDVAEIVAWWPVAGALPPEAVIHRNDDGTTVAILSFAPTPDGGAGMYSAWWDGREDSTADAPDGDYTVRIRLDPGTDPTRPVVVLLPLALRRDVAYPLRPRPHSQAEGFRLGVWAYLAGAYSNADYDEIFRMLREDGFTRVLAFPPSGRYGDCAEAAARQRVHIILNSWETTNLVRQGWSNQGLTEAELRAALEDLVAAGARGGEFVEGYYLVDEPHDAIRVERANRLIRMIEAVADRPGFATLTTAGDWRSRLERLDPPVAIFDRYPLSTDQTNPGRAIAEYAALIEQAVREADRAGRLCWIVGQGISVAASYEPPSPAAMRALVWTTLVAGARGFFPFLYLSTGDLEGLRGFDYSPRPRLETLRRLRQELAAVDALLRETQPAPETLASPTAEETVFARWWVPRTQTASLASTARFLWTVNLDLECTRTLTLDGRNEATGEAAAWTLRLGPGDAVCTPIPEGYSVDRIYSIRDSFAPGMPHRLTLPVLADAPVPAAIPIQSLAVDAAGRLLAAGARRHWYEGGGVFLVDTSNPAAPTLVNRLWAWSAESVRFSPDGARLAICDGLRGLQILDTTDGAAADPRELGRWMTVSGNAHDMLFARDTDDLWVASKFHGLRRLAWPTLPVTFAEIPLDPRQHLRLSLVADRLTDLPVSAAAAALNFGVLDEYTGLAVIHAPATEDSLATQTTLLPFYRGRRMVAGTDWLAVARLEWGLDIYHVREDAPPERVAHIPALATFGELAVWRGAMLLAADGREGIRAFDLRRPAQPRELARIQPWPDEHPSGTQSAPWPERPWVDALAAADDFLAVAARNRPIRLLDARPLERLGAPRGWLAH